MNRLPRPSRSAPPPSKHRDTADALLREGTRLFSEFGYDGVAVDAIVAAAVCNKRMLYHYYNSKEGLYIAVLESVFNKLEQAKVKNISATEHPEKVVSKVLEIYFQFLGKNPEFVRLLMFEKSEPRAFSGQASAPAQ